MRRKLLDFKPNFVHFSGHGSETNGVIFENEMGNSLLASPDALAGLFELFSEQIECVILNACFTENQAKAISEHIDYVIGMGNEISDKSAIEFR